VQVLVAILVESDRVEVGFAIYQITRREVKVKKLVSSIEGGIRRFEADETRVGVFACQELPLPVQGAARVLRMNEGHRVETDGCNSPSYLPESVATTRHPGRTLRLGDYSLGKRGPTLEKFTSLPHGI
jgi:hypothetical protein